MKHFACDRCRKQIQDDELRYVVRIEIEAALHDTDGHHELDHLDQIHSALELAESLEFDNLSDQIYQKKIYDLCPDCFRLYTRNPLAMEQCQTVGFSEN